MKIIMSTEEDLEFSEFDNPVFDVELTSPEQAYGALQMFATSMALCTYSVLYSYGETLGLGTEGLRIRVHWEYANVPFRIGSLDMDVHWPGLPDSRLEAARRAASHCTIHHTLENPPKVKTTLSH